MSERATTTLASHNNYGGRITSSIAKKILVVSTHGPERK